MTINKAIDIIKCLAWHTRPSEEDVEQAIKALEQQPCEDAISRQAYIERYRKWGYSEYGRKMDNEALAIRVAMSLPSVAPKPKTGHWIRKEDKFCWWYECDQCGEKPLHNRLNDKDALSDWCPHCGADMINVPDKNDGKLLEIPTGSESEDKEEMNEQMVFPETFEKFAKEYGFKDDKEVYTNGSELISIFRVKQWLEHDNKLRAIETDTAYECGKHANKWILISERLPKTTGVYRVTRCYPNVMLRPKYLVDACYFDGSDTWYDDNRINHERAYADNVIAWQENPEPYKPQKSEETDADSY
jgi:hypothetical protein